MGNIQLKLFYFSFLLFSPSLVFAEWIEVGHSDERACWRALKTDPFRGGIRIQN